MVKGYGLSTDGVQARGLAHGVVGPARVVAFGVSSVAPAGSVVGGLVILVSYAGFAAPLVVVIAFVASLCCASSIAEFARRLPSAGSLYTYNSRGLGQIGGFLTGWVMIAAYALYAPAGLALTSAFASLLLTAVWHVTIAPWVLFLVILAAVVLIAWLGIATSSSVDLLLAAGEVAVIAALAITILVKTGPAQYSAAVLSPASSLHGQFSDITNAMIYGISAFAGFEAAAALGEEARDSRRSIPAATMAVVIVTGLFYLLVVLAEAFGTGRDGITGLTAQPSRWHHRIAELADRDAATYPAAMKCLLADREGLTAYLRFPAEHHHRIRHSNFIERTFGETRRRTKVIGRLPGETSCLTLVWAVLDRASRGWRGLTMTAGGLRMLQDLCRSLLDPPLQLRPRTVPAAQSAGQPETARTVA